jgi:hypothetical protein
MARGPAAFPGNVFAPTSGNTAPDRRDPWDPKANRHKSPRRFRAKIAKFHSHRADFGRMSRRRTMGLGAGIVLWLSCIVIGFCALQRYAAKAGPSRPPQNAEEFFAAHRTSHRPLLVMMVHPRCPCSDASLAELGDLLARSHGGCDALLLQYHPGEDSPDWSRDVSPRVLGGVHVPVVLDRGGKLAATLGAGTSGHVVFADAKGDMRFTGGLTTSRGHRGRAPGQDAILEVLGGGEPTITAAPVYGCALTPECAAPLCDR